MTMIEPPELSPAVRCVCGQVLSVSGSNSLPVVLSTDGLFMWQGVLTRIMGKAIWPAGSYQCRLICEVFSMRERGRDGDEARLL